MAEIQEAPRTILDLVDEIPNASPEFRLWIEATPTEDFSEIVSALVAKGIVITTEPKDVLTYLNTVVTDNPFASFFISACDFEGRWDRRSIRELRKLMGGVSSEQTFENKIAADCGSISHQAVPALLAGFIPAEEFKRKRKKIVFSGGINRSLFSGGNVSSDPEEESAVSDDLRDAPALQEFFSSRHAQERYLNDVIYLYQRIIGILGSVTPDWQSQLAHGEFFIHELSERLRPVFGGYIDQLDRYDVPFARYAKLITLLTWVTVLPQALNRGKQFLFCEVPILAYQHGFGGWRADAVKVVFAAEKKAPDEDFYMVQKLMRKRFRSVGHLVKVLGEKLVSPFFIRLIDWKFAAGDALGRENIIQSSELIRPARDHLLQIKKYAMLATVDYHLVRGGEVDENISWEEWNHFGKGYLIYFLYNSPPISHTIAVTLSEKERLFTQSIVHSWHRSEKNALHRHTTNFVVRKIKKFIEGVDGSIVIHNGNGESSVKEKELFPRFGANQSVEKLSVLSETLK